MEEQSKPLSWPIQYHEEGDSYTSLLKEMGQIPYKRLMYGEWLADECEDCHTKEDVVRYVDTTGKEKGPIYLCRKCAEPQLKYRREWTPEDDKRKGQS